MKIAMIGIRGVPANYSGLETCAEEVGVRLVSRGHEVVVYCREANYEEHTPEYRGIRRNFFPGSENKFMDTLVHSRRALEHAVRVEKPDVILAFNPAIAGICALARRHGIPFCLNPDGFDWRRPKWPAYGRLFIYASAWLAAKTIDQMTIDAVSVRNYYAEKFGCKREPLYIPNGANIELPGVDDEETTRTVLSHYGLEKDQYILFLSRHVRDNACKEIIAGYEMLDTDLPFVFGGGGHYGDIYAEELKQTRDPRIRFPGPIYDPVHVRILHHNCYFLVHGNTPGGTSLGLLKALGFGTCVMTVDTPDNAYAVKDAGVTYALSPKAIRDTMRRFLDHPEEVAAYRERAVRRIEEEYLWDVVTDKYEAAFRSVLRN